MLVGLELCWDVFFLYGLIGIGLVTAELPPIATPIPVPKLLSLLLVGVGVRLVLPLPFGFIVLLSVDVVVPLPLPRAADCNVAGTNIALGMVAGGLDHGGKPGAVLPSIPATGKRKGLIL